MTDLSFALAALIVTHLVLSAHGLRFACERLVGLLAFRIVYGSVLLIVVGGVIVTYINAADSAWLWTPPAWAQGFAVFVMPAALWLIAIRLVQRPDHARNRIYRIIPAPGSCGLLLWALLHLINVGHARGLLLFGTFAVISGCAAIKNTMMARSLAGWRSIGPIWNWRPPFIAVLLWLFLLAVHPYLSGVDLLDHLLP